MSILGVIVRAQPSAAGGVRHALHDLPGLAIVAASDERFVVVIEDSADASAVDVMARIARLPAVLNTSLVYEYSGPDAPAPDGEAIDFRSWRGTNTSTEGTPCRPIAATS
jgi:nitrate reductase NapAB chaperone NapD